MIQLHTAKGCRPTADILTGLLTKNGVKVGNPAKGHVCWGAGSNAKPALNGACSNFNKLQQLQTLAKAGVLVVPPFYKALLRTMPYPVLARKLHHVGGRDIIYCRDEQRAKRALARGRAYFTRYILSITEFRVWVYRKRHLGTYEKVLAHPEWKHRMIGRNYKNGYAFQLVQTELLSAARTALAIQSVTALGLDFGAVDILVGRDKRDYVLEVNTAPGVEGEGRQVIQALALRIQKWEAAGYPERKAE